jgi:predicted nucleic acid-binding protein
MNAIDTNVWIYSHDGRDPAKQLVAQELIASVRPLALPWQIGCEFLAASRKLAAHGFDEAKAWQALAHMHAMADAVLLPVPQLWWETQVLQTRYTLSFWDGLLAATCIREKVQVLYTEDMGAPRTIESLSLVNPFVTPTQPTAGSHR